MLPIHPFHHSITPPIETRATGSERSAILLDGQLSEVPVMAVFMLEVSEVTVVTVLESEVTGVTRPMR